MAGLYIHIPFCHSKCSYCDFYSTPDRQRIDELLDTIIREYEHRRNEISGQFKTSYLGGGTPSIIPADKLAKLCERLPTRDAVEFTIEANPEDINHDIIAAWKAIGINRVSMGIQSFNDGELKTINRRHDSLRAEQAINDLLTGGISNISCDLIYGLPGQDVGSWAKSLDRLLGYNLPHLSAYCLSYEPGTALYARMVSGKISPTDDETLKEMYSMLCEKCADAGYVHYEISNFAKPGLESKHNSSYWTATPYLGLGPGAHSFDGTVRRYNPSNLKNYIDRFPTTEVEEEDERERYNDMLITALRTANGLDLSALASNKSECLMNEVQAFLANGSMIIKDNHLRISEEAWFTSDSILRELIEV